MNAKLWLDQLREAPRKKALPILSFPSVSLMGITVRELIESAELQAKGMKAIAEQVDAAAAVSMMDLSVEAEAFGAPIRISDDEVPTVTGAIIHSQAEAENLTVPPVGVGRTGRYIEAVRQACGLITDRPVFAGVIGPFSLAGRLMDVTEILVNCYEDPDFVHAAMQKAVPFLIDYINAYRSTGVMGVLMAEPLTGMLSPDLAEEFSEPYVRQIAQAVQDDDFLVVYHNCGDNAARMTDSILRTGCAAYHFGNAVSMRDVLSKVPAGTVVMGNVDPAGQFRNGTPESVRQETLRIMEECCPENPGFIISSGCDIPPASSWENIRAFFQAVEEYYNAHGIR
jgi:uroporphyrinogen decarboxylase